MQKSKKMWLDGKIFNLGDSGCYKFDMEHKWFNVDKGKDIPEIIIYDVIGDAWDGITAKQFIKELNSIDADELLVRINSPGGLVYEGFAIYNALKQFPGKVTTRVDAVAASIASVIFMAGDERQMPPVSDLMVHKPWSFIVGDADDMRNEAEELDRVQGQLERIYADATGIDGAEITEMVNATTWLSGEESFDKGFATQLLEDAKIAACVFNLDSLPGVPERHKRMAEAAQKRSEEKALREQGRSKRDAKTELSPTASRDDGSEAAKQSFIEMLNKIGG